MSVGDFRVAQTYNEIRRAVERAALSILEPVPGADDYEERDALARQKASRIASATVVTLDAIEDES